MTSLERRLLGVLADAKVHNLGDLMGLVGSKTGKTVAALNSLEGEGYVVRQEGGWRLA